MSDIPEGEGIDIYHHTDQVGNTLELRHSKNSDINKLNQVTSTTVIDFERRMGQYGNYGIIYVFYDGGFISAVIDCDRPQIRFRKPVRALGITNTDQLEQLIGKTIVITPYYQVNKDSTPRMSLNNEQFITFVIMDEQNPLVTQQPVIQQSTVEPTQQQPPNTQISQQQPQQINPIDIVTCYKCNKSLPKNELPKHLNECQG